jgi:hypothetical protein
MFDFEDEYMNRLQCKGWNSVAVITSVSSSMLAGLISTMSGWRELAMAKWGRAKILTKALIADVKVPEVDSQIICRYVCLLVRVDGDGMDVIGVGICVNFSGYGSGDTLLLCHAG